MRVEPSDATATDDGRRAAGGSGLRARFIVGVQIGADWRGAADAVTVMVRGDDLERLRRNAPDDRPYLIYTAVAVAAVAAIAVMRRC